MKTEQKLFQANTTTCLVCDHVLNLHRPILYVTHDNDNGWKFSCRHIGHKMEEIKIVPLQQVIVIDATLNDILDMPPGVGAKRHSTKTNWDPFVLYPDSNDE